MDEGRPTNMAAATVPARHLRKLSTPELIGQYARAVSSHHGRYTDTSPRQRRINLIISLISARADAGDQDALTWYES